jgi:hypothetical protein
LRSIRCFFVERASISSWFTVLCFIVTVLLFLAIHLCQLPSQKVSGQLPCTKPGKWAVSCLVPSQESERSVALHQARKVSGQLPCTKSGKWAVSCLAPSQEREPSVALHQTRKVSSCVFVCHKILICSNNVVFFFFRCIALFYMYILQKS